MEPEYKYFHNITGIPDFDAIIQIPSSSPVLKINVNEISVENYFKLCALIQNTSYEYQLKIIDKTKVNLYAKLMKEGRKFKLPYIDFNRKQQEGRHRVMAASLLGDSEVPVAIISRYDQELPEIAIFGTADALNDVEQDNNGYYISFNLDSTKERINFLSLFTDDFENTLIYEAFDAFRSKQLSTTTIKIDLKDINWIGIIDYKFHWYVLQSILKSYTDMELMDSYELNHQTLKKAHFDDLWHIFKNNPQKLRGSYIKVKNYLSRVLSKKLIEYNVDVFDWNDLPNGFKITYTPNEIKIYVEKKIIDNASKLYPDLITYLKVNEIFFNKVMDIKKLISNGIDMSNIFDDLKNTD